MPAAMAILDKMRINTSISIEKNFLAVFLCGFILASFIAVKLLLPLSWGMQNAFSDTPAQTVICHKMAHVLLDMNAVSEMGAKFDVTAPQNKEQTPIQHKACDQCLLCQFLAINFITSLVHALLAPMQNTFLFVPHAFSDHIFGNIFNHTAQPRAPPVL
jgi:hypothetical protein